MPYIKSELRTCFDDSFSSLSCAMCELHNHASMDPGVLNYIITCVIEEYRKIKGTKYQTFNDIIGVLEAAKLELYRRVVGPYEDSKCAENGDVYSEKARTSDK